MDAFEHEELEVYQAALGLVAGLDKLARGLSPGRAVLGDQLLLAGFTVVRELAAGAGQLGPDSQRHTREARSAALQCAGLLDIVRALLLTDEETYAILRQGLLQIVTLLSKGAVAPAAAAKPEEPS